LEAGLNIAEIKTLVLSIPEVSDWPEMAAIFERQVDLSNKVWEMPYRACRAVGGDETLAAPSAAALLCLCCSLLLVDDMLDQDPRGAHLHLGEAKTANISFAFQSAAFRLLSDTAIDAERKAKVMTRFAGMALTTAYGQELDSRNLPGQENYWKVLRAKNCSYFGTGLFAGAIFGNSEVEIAEKLYQFGALTGEATQIQDDISDALEKPANPDWKLNRNNLLLLYAQTADHPDRERFQALRSGTEDPEKLKAAQEILVRCGALSYGAYLLNQRCQASLKILEETPLTDQKPLRELVIKHIRPLAELLESLGIPVPDEIRVY